MKLRVITVSNPNKFTTTWTHRCLHDSLTRLLRDYNNQVNSDHLKLGGWVWRSNERQIYLREKHCGTTHYDVWEKPAGQCSPPTARPGKSSHQNGLAIDFYCKEGIVSKSNCGSGQAFRWLDCNAAKYSLINLTSEPWHWYFPETRKSQDKLKAKQRQSC